MLEETRPIDRVIERVLSVYAGWGRGTPTTQMRADWEKLFERNGEFPPARDDILGNVPVAWVGAPQLPQCPVVIYMHGGGYQVGSIRTHHDLMSRLSLESGITVLGVSYRCAPEYVFPAPIQDCVRVYTALLDAGVAPEQIAFAGDSAGGNLALATVLQLRDLGIPLPSAIGLMSPWTDLEALGESFQSRAESDPIHKRSMILRMAGIYLNGADARQPLASPLNADFSGLPPVFIQVGDRETVLSDSCELAARLEAAGVDVTCQVWDGMIHVFQQYPDELPEALQAIRDMAGFLKNNLLRPERPGAK
jgi:epsilon-lactone hydrolase